MSSTEERKGKVCLGKRTNEFQSADKTVDSSPYSKENSTLPKKIAQIAQSRHCSVTRLGNFWKILATIIFVQE